jgi:AcrR family transcriptional regulator
MFRIRPMSNKKTESLARAVQTAAQMFSEKPFEEVQIAEIAARARCSSATIYEAFQTKKSLFRAALLQNSGESWPDIAHDLGPPSLLPLLEFLTDRISGLSTPSMRNFWRSVCADATHVHNVMQRSLQGTSHLGDIVDEVERCMEGGLLRQGDPLGFAYLILAGSGYEPAVYSLMFSRDATPGAVAILETVLSPLVTEAGQAELAAYVAKSKAGSPGDEAAKPSLLGYLRGLPGSLARAPGAAPKATEPAEDA